MKNAVVPSDLRLTIIGAETPWAGERHYGLPLLRWPSGAICEPVTVYLGWSLETRRVSRGSLKQEAYILREWLAFLLNLRKQWFDVDDDLLKAWRASASATRHEKGPSARRIERKLQVVFEFYRLMPKCLPFCEDGSRRAPFVGPPDWDVENMHPISSKRVNSPRPNAGLMWLFGERHGNQHRRRPTPSNEQADRIISHLRSLPERKHSRREGWRGLNEDALLGERNWLAGRCATEAGLRSAEIANLRIEHIRSALAREDLSVPGLVARKNRIGGQGLEDMERGARASLLGALARLHARGRRVLEVEIIGKGRKHRMAPFPIRLVEDLLNIGVWSIRATQIARWKEIDPSFSSADNFFLSLKTRDPLTSAAIGDILKRAFAHIGVAGSGHRLRAYFATMTAAHLLEEAFLTNGGRLDAGAVNGVLDRLAAMLGHARVTTTLRHYVEQAQLQLQSDSYRWASKSITYLWGALMRSRDQLSAGEIELLKRLVDHMASGDDPTVLEIVRMALDDVRNHTTAPREASADAGRDDGRPRLMIVK